MKYNQLIILFALWFLSSCVNSKKLVNHQDPLEGLNRGLYTVHKTLDALYINPVVQVYTKIFPPKIRALFANFFSNIGEIPVIINSLLQCKMPQALDSAARLTLNSTLGIAGFLDVANNIGLKPKKTDLGDTLYQFGYKESMYLFLPIIGPTTVRDGLGFVGNIFASVPYYFKAKWRNRYNAAYLVQRKSDLTDVQSFMNLVGVDQYVFIRDSYLQRRKYVLNREIDNLTENEILDE